MVEVTLTKILGYLYGIPAVLVGVPLLLLGALISTGFLIAGFALTISGLIAIPKVREVLQDQAGVEFSGWAVAGIVVILGAVMMGGVVVGLLNIGNDDTTQDQPAGPGSDVSDVGVQATDATPNASTYSLDVAWNARAQSAVDPDTDDMSIYNAEDGQKFLVVRMELTNTGNESIDLTPSLFRVVVDGVEHEPQRLFGSSQGGLSQVTVRPDASYDGWVTFSIPEDATSAELIINQDTYFNENVAVSFDHQDSLDINVAD